MSKFKLKLNQMEMKTLGSCCVYAARNMGRVECVAGLAILETCERLWSRMRNMYRPDRDKYTLRLGAMEVHTLTATVLPAMRDMDEPIVRTMGYSFAEELRKQSEREINIYNAMRYGDA